MPVEPMMLQPEEEMIEDGSVEIELPPEEEDQEQEPVMPAVNHRDNLVEFLEEDDLRAISSELVQLYEADATSRTDWLKTYIDGLDYLGFSMEDRTQPFKNASGVFHPVMSEAVVRFQSNAVMEIFPASGPVLVNVMGDENPDKIARGKRVKTELNYQLTDNMPEYRPETEQMLFRLPLAGSVFKKIYHDPLKGRTKACMIPAEDFVVNYGCSELEDAERYTHVMKKSANEIRKLQRVGFYRKVKLPTATPTTSEGTEKEDKVMGREPSMDADERHTILEIYTSYNLPGGFEDPDDIADPYIITIDKSSGIILSIYRNWDEKDPQRNHDQYFVHYQYMPGLGFYGIGLVHLLGSIAKASTSILRQLVDAGTLSNLPGGLKTKGLRTKGEDQPIQPGEWRDVEVPAGSIRDNLFALPYKEPSVVLVQLLGMIVDEGRRIGSIADLEISSSSQNAPVGTTLALMERSLKVMSAVHARLHASLRKELKMIARCISEYMPPKYDWDEEGKFNRAEDFDGRVDIIPVSDPNAATQAQKIVQMQAVQQLAAMNPELYNLKELHRAGLQAIGIKDDERILPTDNPPPRMDPVQENMAILTSQPIKVYQDQDHTAHIQVHLSAMNDPKILEMVGKSPNAPKLMGQMEAHIVEHLAFQYREEIEQQMGVELPPMGEPLPPEVETRLSRLLADASVRLREKHEAEAKEKQAEEIASDPVFQLREREVALKERKQSGDERIDMLNLIVEIAEKAAREQIDIRRIESQESTAGAEIGANLVTFGAKLESDERREGVKLGKEIAENIRADQRSIQELEQQANHVAAERESKLEIARINAAKAKKPKDS